MHAPPLRRSKFTRPCAPAPRVHAGMRVGKITSCATHCQQERKCTPRLPCAPVVRKFERPPTRAPPLNSKSCTPHRSEEANLHAPAPLRPACERADFEGGVFLRCWGYVGTYINDAHFPNAAHDWKQDGVRRNQVYACISHILQAST